MNTCGTCKHRGEPIMTNAWDSDDLEEYPTTYFLCDRIKHDDGWKYLAGQWAVVTDGSGYKAALCVESDFGCNLWEGK